MKSHRTVPTLSSDVAGRAVVVPDGAAVLPATCACCGEVASHSRAEVRPNDSVSVIVPYCSICHQHAGAAATRTLAVGLASVVLALTLATALPLLWSGAHWLVVMIVSLALSLAPIGVGFWWPARPAAGHVSAGRAVWWLDSGELACLSPVWAESLASSQDLPVRSAALRAPRFSPWWLAGPLLAALFAPALHQLQRPLVRVLNLTPVRLDVLVDGERYGSVDPTSAENPTAGVELRIPAGKRQLQAIGSDGRLLAEAEVTLRVGRSHLYAPASEQICFWVETVGYGQAGTGQLDIDPLVGMKRFWVLPEIDTWFAPNPPPEDRDRRSSGGRSTALRQARCRVAPEAVREAQTFER